MLDCKYFDKKVNIHEAICLMETKINEIVDAYNRVDADHKVIAEKVKELEKLIDYLLGAGLAAEVKKKLEEWLADGTLADIIGDTLSKWTVRIDKLETDVTSIKQQLSDVKLNTQKVINVKEHIGEIGLNVNITSKLQELIYEKGSAIYYFPKGIYEITSPIYFGVDRQGKPIKNFTIIGESRESVIYINFPEALTNRSGFNIGSITSKQNFNHSIKNLTFTNSKSSPTSTYGLTMFNPYIFTMENVEFRTYNSFDLNRSGDYGYTALNVEISNSTFYAGYYSLDGYNYLAETTPQGRYSINNKGVHKLDNVNIRNCQFNSYCIINGTQVVVEGCQFYNSKKVKYTSTQSGYSDKSTFCIEFTEGSLYIDKCNFEVYQNAIYLGGYNRYVENCKITNTNFNGIAYSGTEEFAYNGIVLGSGGVGFTHKILIDNCKFAMNMKSDVIIDNTGANQNNIKYVDGIEIINCSSNNNAFSTYHEKITVNNSDIITLSEGTLYKQFFGTSANIKIGSIEFKVLRFPTSSSIQIERVITAIDQEYTRINDGLIVKSFIGDITEGQVKTISNANTPFTKGTFIKGDIINNTSPTSGGYIGYVCTNSGTNNAIWKGFGKIEE